MKPITITIVTRSKDEMVARIIIHDPVIIYPNQEKISFTLQDLNNNQYAIRVEISNEETEK